MSKLEGPRYASNVTPELPIKRDGKHTPAPWHVEVTQDTTTIESKYFTIATEVSNSDADLIAAAPDLLKALKNLVKAANQDKLDPLAMFATIEQAKHAINKAEGVK